MTRDNEDGDVEEDDEDEDEVEVDDDDDDDDADADNAGDAVASGSTGCCISSELVLKLVA